MVESCSSMGEKRQANTTEAKVSSNLSFQSVGLDMAMSFLSRQAMRSRATTNTASSPYSSSSYRKRLIKFLLCTSLFLYFYTTYKISSAGGGPTPPGTRIISPLKKIATHLSSRAVIEDNQKKLPSMGSTDLKVYVYDLPPRYNSGWLSDARCASHLFAAEVALHRALLGSPRFRTLNPSEADYYFVPVYVSCNFSTPTGLPSLAHSRALLASAIDLIASEMPYWNRSGGADHVFVASHDYGACFHAVEELAVTDGIPGFLRRSVVLQTFGVRSQHPCQEVEHVLIPPFVPPEGLRSALEKTAKRKKSKRDIFAFFRGKMELHPRNFGGHFYGKGVRTALWKRYRHHRKFYLRRSRFAGYQEEMARSVFCLCPLGWAPWSPRLVESVALGCVPVIIADGIRLPFPSAVPWPRISLTVAEKDVPRLARILSRVAATNVSAIQRNLWRPSVRRALLYSRGNVEEGDATWLVLDALSERLQQHRPAPATKQWRTAGGF